MVFLARPSADLTARNVRNNSSKCEPVGIKKHAPLYGMRATISNIIALIGRLNPALMLTFMSTQKFATTLVYNVLARLSPWLPVKHALSQLSYGIVCN